jgi:hypothetical protein
MMAVIIASRRPGLGSAGQRRDGPAAPGGRVSRSRARLMSAGDTIPARWVVVKHQGPPLRALVETGQQVGDGLARGGQATDWLAGSAL